MFGRSKSPTPEVGEAEVEPLTGKGRPTPTRKEAEAARKQRIAVPKTRKEQAAAQRARTREFRAKQQVAMQKGDDDRYLPERDRGPVRRYVRDWVDGHRTIGELVLPLFFLIFVMTLFARALAGVGAIVWILVIALMVADSIRVGRGAKLAVKGKFGDDKTKGVAMYAVMRGWQMRRLRLPKPQVKPGEKI